MFLHVDLAARRVCPFPPDMYERVSAAAAAHAGLPYPAWSGRRIAMPGSPVTCGRGLRGAARLELRQVRELGRTLPAMLEIDGLTRRFGAKLAVDNVSLRIENGCFVGVIGPSGAGKSTLLRLISRLLEPSAGRILFGGIEVTALRGRALRQWRARAAMIFQQFNLIGRLDVLTNVLIGRIARVPQWRALLGLWPDRDKVIALAALEASDWRKSRRSAPSFSSGGQQQRVAIARTMRSRSPICCSPTSRLPRSIRITSLS